MENQYTEQKLVKLQEMILEVLQAHPSGIREFDLMEALAEKGASHYQARVVGDQLSMFQCHFLLFHCLYRLRDRLRLQTEAELIIHCLNIVMHPYEVVDSSLPQTSDALRDYYLDLNNLAETTADDVNALLDQFWRRFVADEQHQGALNVLGIKAPVTFEEVKAQYRRLAMEYHPDRGGDTEKLQAINEAMAQLRVYYS